MQLKIYTKLSKELIKKVELFLNSNSSVLNPLFSSPLWAERLENLIGFKYKFLLIEKNDEIYALHLVFEGFRGYSKINKLPKPLHKIARFYSKSFYGYLNWYNLIVFSESLTEEKKEEMKKLIYDNIYNYKLQSSPIYKDDTCYFNNQSVSKWGTYILDVYGKTYEEIFLSFKRQAKRPIKKTKEQGVTVKLLKVDDTEKYIKWLKENQKETGKFYKIDLKNFQKEFELFNKDSYIYEIFVAYQDDVILGSLGIWGYNDFISEWGVYQSKLVREKKLYVQDVIKDSIIKYMFENNIRYYDFAGFNPNEDASPKEIAIKQFKAKFSGVENIYNTVGN